MKKVLLNRNASAQAFENWFSFQILPIGWMVCGIVATWRWCIV